MRKLYSFIILAMTAIMSLTLTSCEDEYIASGLEGTWEGYTHMQAEYHERYYNSTYSYVDFTTDPFRFTSGYGHWVDYYSGAPWDYIASNIEWRVRDGVIEIKFIEDGYTLYIDRYRLTDNHFTGRAYSDDGYNYEFDLVHTSSPRWDDYYYGWDDGYYYAPAKGGAKAPVKERPQRVLR